MTNALVTCSALDGGTFVVDRTWTLLCRRLGENHLGTIAAAPATAAMLLRRRSSGDGLELFRASYPSGGLDARFGGLALPARGPVVALAPGPSINRLPAFAEIVRQSAKRCKRAILRLRALQ